MHAEDLVELINTYNSHEDELFDRCADRFISKVRDELEKTYDSGNWTRMVGITQLGISLIKLSDNFQEFEFDILLGYPVKFGQSIHDEFGFSTFKEFIESKSDEELKSDVQLELSGFQGEDILLIKPFYEALKRKGFECYVDTDNYQLIVALNIKNN